MPVHRHIMAKRNNSHPDRRGQELPELDRRIAGHIDAIMELLTSSDEVAPQPTFSAARKRTAAKTRPKRKKNPS